MQIYPLLILCSACTSRNGARQRFERRSEEHVQRREEGEATSHDQAIIEGHHQVPFGYAKARFVFSKFMDVLRLYVLYWVQFV